MSEIVWPVRFTPGTTDNFVSNEVIVAELKAADVWPLLTDTSKWESCYGDVSDITFPESELGPLLEEGSRFSFATLGFSSLQAQVVEFQDPSGGKPGRLAWRAWQEGDQNTSLDVHHAWLLEDLPGERLRVLTQESQIGQPARELAASKPNKMLNGHQDWLNGLIRAAAQPQES